MRACFDLAGVESLRAITVGFTPRLFTSLPPANLSERPDNADRVVS